LGATVVVTVGFLSPLAVSLVVEVDVDDAASFLVSDCEQPLSIPATQTAVNRLTVLFFKINTS